MKKLLLLIIVGISFIQFSNAQTEVTFYTNQGDIVLELEDTLTPITAGNMMLLSWKGFYDGVIFHRVIPNFMIQGGDPLGTGSGGPGYSIPDEFDASLSNVRGTISMANSGPNTGGSQFFINLINNTRLDFDKTPFTSKHPVFGTVISGMTVVDAIGVTPTGAQDRPVDSMTIDSMRVTSRPICNYTTSFTTSLPSAVGMCDGTAMLELSGGIVPMNILWESDAGAGSTSLATGLCEGKFKVIAIDSFGCSLVSEVELKIIPPASIEKSKVLNQYVIAPNPATDLLMIAGGDAAYAHSEIYNLLGSVVLKSTQRQIDISDLSKGIYVVKTFDQKGQLAASLKLVKR